MYINIQHSMQTLAFAYWTSADRDPILPGFVGLNMIIIALRLFWMNQASREAERMSRERLARHEPDAARPAPYRQKDYP